VDWENGLGGGAQKPAALMPAITFDVFDAGLDVSKGRSVAGANQLRTLTNAYVTTGKALRKRPGLTKVATLEAGTKGLVGAKGKLHTFYAKGSITHSNTLFQANFIPHPNNSAQDVNKIHSGTDFNGYIYVVAEYDDTNVYHHYLDDPGAWAASTAYNLGDFRRPTTPNGFRYEVTTAGTSGGSEPAWPTTVGTTVTDGTVVWTCRSHNVTDANCPQSKAIAKTAQKIWAIDNEVVRFTATASPRDWTTANDAGFLPTGLQALGDPTATALGTFRNYLAVFGGAWVQVWVVDPDPAKHSLFDQVQGLGTTFPRSVADLSGDSYFLSSLGFRSVTLASATQNIKDLDVGSAIDKLVRQDIPGMTDPVGIYWPGGGQYLCADKTTVWVYSFSRTAKISGWSKYTLPVSVDDMTVLGGDLYIRSGDEVYKLDDSAYTDNGSVFKVNIDLPYMDMKSPGVLKQIIGVDTVVDGSGKVAIAYDARDTTRVTQQIAISGNTRPGDITPVEVCATEASVMIENEDDKAFELQAVTMYYENLGPV